MRTFSRTLLCAGALLALSHYRSSLADAQVASAQLPLTPVPRRRSLQLMDGFGVNLPLPREPRLLWTKHWWTRVSDSGVKWVRLGQYENSSEQTSWDWVERSPGILAVNREVDEAIQSLTDNGVTLDLQLCYGNALYDGDPKTRPAHSDPAPPELETATILRQ